MFEYSVVGLGQCSLDILGRLDEYPELDQKAELSELLVQGGGPVATALVTLARLDVSTAMIGRVGDDDFGEKIIDGLQAEEVDCQCLVAEQGCASQVAFIAVDACGHRNIFWHRGSQHPFSLERKAKDLITATRVLHLDGLHLEPALAAAQLARSSGVITVLDAGTLRPGIEQLLPLVDHLVVSEKFARQAVAGGNPEQALDKLAGYGARAVTVTLGKDGSLSRSMEGELFLQPAFEVDVVDTTGCGDVFHGGYIYGLLQSWALPEIVRFAAACAALKARELGGRTGIPRLREVIDYLEML